MSKNRLRQRMGCYSTTTPKSCLQRPIACRKEDRQKARAETERSIERFEKGKGKIPDQKADQKANACIVSQQAPSDVICDDQKMIVPVSL